MKQVVLAICLLIGVQVFAQVQFGVKAGGNIATTKDLIAFPKNRVGWYGGLRGSIGISKKITAEPELIYTTKGYRYIDLSGGETVAMRMNYLAMPILLKYNIGTKTSMNIGGELSYLINATVLSTGYKLNASSSFPKKVDFGLVVGMQYKILQSIGFEIRYVYGLRNYYQTDAVGVRRGEYLAGNRVLQLGFMYNVIRKRN